MWRDFALRSAGFPADMLLAVCDETLANTADLDGLADGGGLAYDAAYAEATRRLSRAIGIALRLDLEGHMHAWPERLLRDRLSQIADPAARTAALEPVRDVQVQLGATLTQALAPPLGLVLDSARWLVNDVTTQYRTLFGQIFDSESACAGSALIPLARFIVTASPYLISPYRTLSEITAASAAELQKRWQAVLEVPLSARRHHVRADAIAARVAEAFPWQPVTWSRARQHSPGIMIAAASADAVRRGDFLLILGGLQLATDTLDRRSFAEHWAFASVDSVDPPENATIMAGADMFVARRGDDLVVRCMSSGVELDFFEVIGKLMSGAVVNAFQPLAPAAHRPRVTIDRLVLSREQWTIGVKDSEWAFVKDEKRRYYEARRWRAKYGLPERVFFRVPVEGKPKAASFRSIALVNILAKLVRQTMEAGFEEYDVSEMLPDVDQLWLSDSAGRRYSSELRFVALDGTS